MVRWTYPLISIFGWDETCYLCQFIVSYCSVVGCYQCVHARCQEESLNVLRKHPVWIPATLSNVFNPLGVALWYIPQTFPSADSPSQITTIWNLFHVKYWNTHVTNPKPAKHTVWFKTVIFTPNSNWYHIIFCFSITSGSHNLSCSMAKHLVPKPTALKGTCSKKGGFIIQGVSRL
jgi:hypothetical protein